MKYKYYLRDTTSPRKLEKPNKLLLSSGLHSEIQGSKIRVPEKLILDPGVKKVLDPESGSAKFSVDLVVCLFPSFCFFLFSKSKSRILKYVYATSFFPNCSSDLSFFLEISVIFSLERGGRWS